MPELSVAKRVCLSMEIRGCMRSIGCRLTETRRQFDPTDPQVSRDGRDRRVTGQHRRSSSLWVKLQWLPRKGRREGGPPHERRPIEAPGEGLGGARDRFHPPPGPLTRRSNDENDGETESCEEKGAQGRSQGTEGQARREEGRETRNSGSRGPRTPSPDRQESLTPPRPEGREGAPGRRPEGRGSPRCPQGGGARPGAPRRQKSRRASPRGEGGGSPVEPSPIAST